MYVPLLGFLGISHNQTQQSFQIPNLADVTELICSINSLSSCKVLCSSNGSWCDFSCEIAVRKFCLSNLCLQRKNRGRGLVNFRPTWHEFFSAIISHEMGHSDPKSKKDFGTHSSSVPPFFHQIDQIDMSRHILNCPLFSVWA